MNDKPQIVEDLSWWTVDKPGWTPLQIALAVALLVLLLLTALYLYRRKKAGLPLMAGPPPGVAALKALRELEPLMTEGNYAEFVVRVSGVLRTYIQDRFKLRAMHRSTEEFLREAQYDNQLSPQHQELLGIFLGQCDMVKFARRGMAVPEMESLLQTARSFVEATPQPEPAPAGKA